MTEELKLYADRDICEMDRAGNYYCRHVSAMTGESLHSKSAIAAELAWRDWQIEQLRVQLPIQEAKAEPAEVPYDLRQWAMDDEPESTLFDEGYNAARRWVRMQLEKPAEPFQKPTLLKECSVRYSDSSGGVCRSEYKGGPEQTTEPTEAVELLRAKFPRIDPCQPVPLDEVAHCCEYTIYVERERLHRFIDDQHNRLMANHSADDLNMVKVPRDLLCRWECELDQIPNAFHISDEMAALLGGDGCD